MLGLLIRKNLNLASVQLYGVSGRVNLEELVQELLTCPGLIQLSPACQHEDLGIDHFDQACVSFGGPESLIQGLTYPHFRLKILNLLSTTGYSFRYVFFHCP